MFQQALCNTCAISPCQNGGTCTETSPSIPSCTCYAGYEQPHCADRDECEVQDVCNNGECINTPGSFHCQCHQGYEGSHCKNVEDVCSTSPCRNNGTCQAINDGQYMCSCYSGFDPHNRCGDKDECQRAGVCHNNGTCVNTVGSFTCTCKQGYFGDHCESDVDECRGSPCDHGTCINHPGYFRCRCNNGYSGLYCDAIATPFPTLPKLSKRTSSTSKPFTSMSTATLGTVNTDTYNGNNKVSENNLFKLS